MESSPVLKNRDAFDSLGRDARTGEPLLPPFHEASAHVVGAALAALLHEQGLSPAAIMRVGVALITAGGDLRRRPL